MSQQYKLSSESGGCQKFGKSIKGKVVNSNVPLPSTNRKILVQRKNQTQQAYHPKKAQSPSKSSRGPPLSPTRSQTEVDSLNQSRISISKSVRFSLDINGQQTIQNTFKKNKSILKNIQRNSLQKQSSSKSLTSLNSNMGSIICSLPAKQSVKDEGLICQNVQYGKIMNNLKENKQKYFDDVFLPGSSSLFYSKKKAKDYENVKWMRIQQIFKGKNIKLRNNEGHRPIITQGTYYLILGQFQTMGYMATCFNALSTSNRALQRIFQKQEYHRSGIFYLRLNHGGIWKYIVVDDFIPVIKNQKGELIPIHLNVLPNKTTRQIYIWPLILQKGFAKMYSCYECLQNQSVQNFMNELTGLVSETINMDSQLSDYHIRNKLSNPDNILIAEQPININQFQTYYYPIAELKQDAYFVFDTKIELINQNNERVVDLSSLKKLFKYIKVYKNDETFYSIGCCIKQTKNYISVRKLQITQSTLCDLTIIQKDKKYFRNTGYNYSWVRVIISMKESQDSYRWINGSYSNNKISSINCVLEPGNYQVVVMIDWLTRPYEVILNYQGNTNAKFIRQSGKDYTKLMNETCVDIAQRFGTFKQLSKYICCYRYIDRKNGFIIQNIHNESRRQVFYHRQYKIPGKRYEILSQPLTSNNELEVFMNPLSQFTFILKFVNGPDHDLINNFDYGFG